MPEQPKDGIQSNRTISRYAGRWLVAIPLALVPALLSAELLRFSGHQVCSHLQPQLLVKQQKSCVVTAKRSINTLMLWIIWVLLVRVSYRYWPYLVTMVKEGEQHDF